MRAQQLFNAALEAKRAGELPRALCLMQRAQSAWPKAAFSFNVAQLQRELGMCEAARESYRAFLDNERDAARRRPAEQALAELGQCARRDVTAPAASSCAAWEAAALSGGALASDAPQGGEGQAGADGTVQAPKAAPNAVAAAPTPSQVARAQAAQSSPQLLAAPRQGASSAKHGVRRYLPWIFAGVGVACVAMTGYEIAQIAAAERDLKRSDIDNPEFKMAERDGRTAETLSWVFGGAAALSLGAALVLALTNSDSPPPSAANE